MVGAAGLPALHSGQAGCGCADRFVPLQAAGAFKPFCRFAGVLIPPRTEGMRETLKNPTAGRGGGIRTHGLFVPNEARYQTALRPDMLVEENSTRLRGRARQFLDFKPPCKRIFPLRVT